MPVIAPFRGVRFNPDAISFISRVIAPPYDVIDASMEQALLARDPYNIVRLTLGRTPQDGRPDEVYWDVAEQFSQWRAEHVLIRDDVPSLYVVEQSFALGDRRFVRHGFIGSLLLEELGKGSVLPHERTGSAARTDRLKLLTASRANFSQILMVYSDPDGAIDAFVRTLCEGRPLCSFRENADTAYHVWAVDDPEKIEWLTTQLRAQTSFIADGHHRYESAYQYAQQTRAEGAEPGSAPEDHIAALHISVANEGLRSLATHRRVKANFSLNRDELLGVLRQNFEVTQVEVQGAETLQQDFDRARRVDPCIACYLPRGGLCLLKVRDPEWLRARFPTLSDARRNLPVEILHRVILQDVLRIVPGSPEEATRVDYRHDAAEIHWGVESGNYDVGFLLSPTDPQTVQQLAAEGERLPPKSTYFFPKLPSGLVIYTHQTPAVEPPTAFAHTRPSAGVP